MKVFATEIYSAVQSGRLSEPFSGGHVRDVCPGWADHTYFTFLGKHSIGNGRATELFVRVGRGLYRLYRPQ
jgi:hypothetical protein